MPTWLRTAHLWSSLSTQESFQLCAMSTRMIIWTIMNTPDPKRASQAAWQAQCGVKTQKPGAMQFCTPQEALGEYSPDLYQFSCNAWLADITG